MHKFKIIFLIIIIIKKKIKLFQFGAYFSRPKEKKKQIIFSEGRRNDKSEPDIKEKKTFEKK